jgi:hypothetical protein
MLIAGPTILRRHHDALAVAHKPAGLPEVSRTWLAVLLNEIPYDKFTHHGVRQGKAYQMFAVQSAARQPLFRHRLSKTPSQLLVRASGRTLQVLLLNPEIQHLATTRDKCSRIGDARNRGYSARRLSEPRRVSGGAERTGRGLNGLSIKSKGVGIQCADTILNWLF